MVLVLSPGVSLGDAGPGVSSGDAKILESPRGMLDTWRLLGGRQKPGINRTEFLLLRIGSSYLYYIVDIRNTTNVYPGLF